MKLLSPLHKKHSSGSRAQAIVEFAIVLPILLMILVGIFEFARMVFIYSAVTNASRNAVRYAAAVGLDDTGLTRFNYCEGIKKVASNSAFLVRTSDFNIQIDYDHGPDGSGPFAECNLWNAAQVDSDVSVTSGDRVHVTVSATYRPMVRLIPLPTKTFTSSSYRTIFGVVSVGE
ncbi:MAG: TadE/TadG family type IV pilus assembly protein [Anaerolineales bacterium]